MDKTGTPLTNVITDIDGESRNPATPDIGADEFSTDPDDAGIALISGPTMTFPEGINPVFVKIVNNGTNDLDSVRVNWTVNGVPQSTYYWTGTILSGGFLDSVQVGTFNFIADTAYDITTWTSLPNGNADTDNSNDTSSVQNLYPALNGVYTIGGTSPDYPTFTAAITALTNGGVIGNVTFNVRTGTYTEQITIGQILGTSASKRIVFQSETGDSTDVILTYNGTSTNPFTLKLNGSDWLRFQKMTFKGTNTNYARIIIIENNANHNEFYNNVIEGKLNAGTSSNHSLIFEYNNGVNEHNTFYDNHFINGSYGIYYYGAYNSGHYVEGIEIIGNTFTNQGYQGIYLNYQNGFRIEENIITTTTSSNYYGIYIYNSYNGYSIIKNKITGIQQGDGIYLSADGTPTSRGYVINNFISVGEGGNFQSNGLYTYYSDYANIYHNNIRVGSTNSDGKALYLINGGNIDLRNNILANEGGGYVIHANATTLFSMSDYNDLFTSGGNLAYWAGATIPNITTWRTTTSLDANSISIDPSFTSPSDLHVAQNALDSAAVVLAIVTDDIDGDARSATHPDIGADEFGAAATDDIGVATITSPTNDCDFGITEQITVNLTNFGTSAATGFNVTVIVDDTITVTENVGALTLNSAGTQPYTFTATFDFSVQGYHSIKAFTTMATDVTAANDTAVTTIQHFASPNITFSPASPTICVGGTRTIYAYGGNTYQWNVVSSGNNITVSPLVTTTYYVTVTNANGCVANDSIVLVVHPLPVATASNTGAYCDGQTIQLQANGGTNYSWQGPNGYANNTQNPTITNAVALDAGTYYVTVTDVSGCVDSASTVVNVTVCNEICNNGIDDDGDGFTDCQDTDCHNNISLSAMVQQLYALATA
ncbi:MAG: hypothetical protein HC803_01970 [Saprospiraceae bacterium]|nr:hypothetical protein [Saprospiraceae bacterium]